MDELLEEGNEEILSNSIEDINDDSMDDDDLSLDSLINDVEQEEAKGQEPTKEEIVENKERAERLAKRLNNGLLWSVSKFYPLAEVEEKKIQEGEKALVSLAEKYGDSMPSWVDNFLEKPELKAGLYVGSLIFAARNTHIQAMIAQQEEAKEQGGASGN